MFSDSFNALAGSDQTKFGEICNKLLLRGFMCRDMYDSREQVIRNNPDYLFMDKYIDLFEDYLKYAGWTLKKDDNLGVFALFNDHEQNRIRIDRDTSIILVVLRMIYDNSRVEGDKTTRTLSSSSQFLFLTTPEVIRQMQFYGIFLPGRRLSGRLVCRSLRFLANHNVISKVKGSYDEGNVSFYILPSIVYALDNDKIVAMSKALDELRSRQASEDDEGGSQNETVNES